MSSKLKYPINSDGFAYAAQSNTEIKEFMNLYNFVVINALTPDECEKAVNQSWKEMNEHGNGKLDKNNPETWITENWPLPDFVYLSNHPTMTEQNLKNMVNKNIVNAYKVLFNHNQICPDVGIISIKRPLYLNDVYMEEWKLNPLKLHYDRDTEEQYYKYNDRYQGCLALVDCGYDIGGPSCVPGSANEVKKNPNLWTNVNQGKYITNGKESGFLHANIQNIPLKAGNMLIWNRATAHSNFTNNSNKPRIVHFFTYVEKTKIGMKLNQNNVIDFCKKNPKFLNEIKKYEWTTEEKKIFGIF